MLQTVALVVASAARPSICKPRKPTLASLRAARFLRASCSTARHASKRASLVTCYRASEGSDLEWSHVAHDIKRRLAKAVGQPPQQDKIGRLQSWLSEAKLKHSGETDIEDQDQTEAVAEMAADSLGLESLRVDVQSWLSDPEPSQDDTDSKMTAVLMQRLLQAYHEQTGKGFDDEDESCYDTLFKIASAALGPEAGLEADMLKRMVQAYVLLPSGGA